jgi:hypothetical protein
VVLIFDYSRKHAIFEVLKTTPDLFCPFSQLNTIICKISVLEKLCCQTRPMECVLVAKLTGGAL